MPSEPPPLPGRSPQPSVPPPLPEARAASSGTASSDEWQRLHPLSLLVVAADLIKNLTIPLIVAILAMRSVAALFAVAGFLLLPAAVFSLIRHFLFQYRFDDRELVIRHGLIERHERRIPFARVQDVSLEQTLASRLLGLARIRVETAGGSGEEASLRYIALPLAETLVREIFQFRAKASGPVEAAGAPPPAEETTLLETPLHDLLLGGLTTRITAALLALLGLLPYGSTFLGWNRSFPPATAENLERFSRQAPSSLHFLLTESIGRALLLIVGGLLFSVVAYALRFYRFRLTLIEDLLRREFGFFTRHSSTIPRRRIQLVRIEESFLRRIVRRASVQADTAADRASQQENEQHRGVLAPILLAGRAAPLIEHLFPGFAADDASAWLRVSPKAVGRTVRFTSALVLMLTAAAWPSFGPRVLALGALVPVIWLLARKSYQHTGYRLSGSHFHVRSGWINRSTHIIPIRNVQGTALRQTPFDRRLGLATLVIDTAGQSFTGGAPTLANLPRATADALAAQLAREAARLRYNQR